MTIYSRLFGGDDGPFVTLGTTWLSFGFRVPRIGYFGFQALWGKSRKSWYLKVTVL